MPGQPGLGPVRCRARDLQLPQRVALGRPFGLALINGGRNRIGETLSPPSATSWSTVVVAETVLYDPEGTKDG